jgi:hypothetical protein
MTRTAVRQEEQVQPSETYDDTIAPSLANYETNAAHAEDDFNSVRSQLHNLLKVQTGNWYDDLNTPATFENGAKRGVNDLNTDLHELERKRLLRRHAMVGVDVPVPAGVAATGTLTTTATPANNETVTIGSTVYTYKTALTPAAYEVLIGGSQAQAMENLRRAINDDGVAGTNYGAGTVAHPDVTAVDGATTVVVTAKVQGTAGNTIATTETLAAVGSQWGGATLSGGVGDMVILGAGDLPSNLVAAIGAVTTRGTVCAYNSSFGTATLDEVAGASDIQPNNLVKIVEASSRDPILDGSGREIMALMQSESNTDGSTITASSPNQVQLSFVVLNSAGDDLIIVDGQYIAGQTIDYAYVERNALEDLPEHAFLGEDFTDVGVSATTRQAVYDNQGIVPVDLTTNATLDLEGAGLIWAIRDDLEALLFRVIEGSAGGTSEIEFGADVDSFDNDAQTNDFANELKVDTAGTEIDIGVTAGTIETTGSDDLKVRAAGELYLDDGNQVGSTWAQTDGIKLSDTTAEWDAFEAEFGEVSLLNAIVQAAQSGVTRCKAVAQVLSADIAANTLIEGANGPGAANISADLCDYRGLTFVDEVDIYINGLLQRNGANAAANHDVYPSAVAAEQQYGCFYAEYDLKYRGGLRPDVITMIVWGTPVP